MLGGAIDMRAGANLKKGSPRRVAAAGAGPRFLMAAAAAVFILSACSDAGSRSNDAYLMRVGSRTVTVGDFKREFEIVKSAYPHNLSQNSAPLQEARMRLLDQLIEEQVLLERAAELRIEISEAELEQAIADIRKDYPEGVFEQLLLDQAVSYSSWKKRLRLKLLMKKVIAHELEQDVTITPEDITAFYKKNYPGKDPVPDGENGKFDELLIAQLRREKMEDRYRLWIKAMRSKYPVDINQSEWKRLTGS